MVKMLKTGCVLNLQLQIYSQTLTYPDLEKAHVESLNALKRNTLEKLKNEADYIGLNDKHLILEERIKLFEKTIKTFFSAKCTKCNPKDPSQTAKPVFGAPTCCKPSICEALLKLNC